MISRAGDSFTGKGKNRRRHSRWLCQCECGARDVIRSAELRKGKSGSCGCYAAELSSHRNRREGSAFREVVCAYKASARVRGLAFMLSPDECKSLFEDRCFYCHTEPYNKNERSTGEVYVYSGIDRVDSSVGYVFSNCVSCCVQCNKMKMQFSQKAFVEKCAQIARIHAAAR